MDNTFEQFSFPDIDEFTYGSSRYVNNLFRDAEKKRKDEAKTLIEKLVGAAPVGFIIFEGLKKNEIIQLVLSDEAKKNLKNHKWNWMDAKDKDGFFRAVIKDENGKIREQAKLKKENLPQGIDMTQMAMAMQGMAIQQQLSDISEKLDVLFDSVSDVLAGQHNDRLGLYYSAENMFRESLKICDSSRKEQIMIAAISNLSTSIEQIKQTTIYEIGKINSNYDSKTHKFKKTVKQEDITEVKRNFQVLHKAIALKVAIYCYSAEYNAAVYTLLEYKNFLNVAFSSGKWEALYYSDSQEKSLQGFWNIQQNKYPAQIDLICQNIRNYDNYFIECKRGEIA